MLQIKYRPRRPIKEWREKRKWTQDKLAERLGISRSHLANLENGHRLLDDYMIARISKALAYRKAS